MEQFSLPSIVSDVASSCGRAYTTQDWESRRELITQLYSVEDRSLEEVMAVMSGNYGFQATKRQYLRRISQWHLDKRVKDNEYRYIVQKQKYRAAHEDKDTMFRVRGRSVEPEKIIRAVKRKKISDEDLSLPPTAPTPADITYYTPSAIDPRSPDAQSSVKQSPIPNINSPDHIMYPQSPLKDADQPIQPSFSSFLVSPGYLPATPAPTAWYGIVSQTPTGAYQTPPGAYQSPTSFHNGPFYDMETEGIVGSYGDNLDGVEPRRARLITLMRKTESDANVDYMKTMLEINSLVYDLIGLDTKSRRSIEDTKMLHCNICKVLQEIGTKEMTDKVESERILLEAIAVSKGSLGENHIASFHFLLKLFILYKNWACRYWDRFSVAHQLRQRSSTEPILRLEMEEATKSQEFHSCLFLLDPEEFLRSSSSTIAIRAALRVDIGIVRNSPQLLWEECFLQAFYCEDGEGLGDCMDLKLENCSMLDLIVKLGPTSRDGSSYFWMAIFISAVHKNWKPIFNSRFLIGKTARLSSLPGATSLEATLERLLDNPYRLSDKEASTAIGDQQREENDAQYRQSLINVDTVEELPERLEYLEVLAMVLAEISLMEAEKAGNARDLRILCGLMDGDVLMDIVDTASRLGFGQLISGLKQVFNDSALKGLPSWSEMLNNSRYHGYDLPLFTAVRAGHLRTVEALIDAGSDLNITDDSGHLPVEVAADADHYDIVWHLIKRGATSNGHEQVIKCVIESSDRDLHNKFLKNTMEKKEWCSFLYAIMLVGQLEEYELLESLCSCLKDAVQLEVAFEERCAFPILEFFMQEYMRELVDMMKDLDSSSRGLELLLNTLTGVHVEQQARLMLSKFIRNSSLGTLAETDETTGFPVLHSLVERNAPNALRVFLSLRPDLNRIDNENNTALHIAADHNRLACARELLDSSIDGSVKNRQGETALQISIRKGYESMADQIMLTGMETNHIDEDVPMI